MCDKEEKRVIICIYLVRTEAEVRTQSCHEAKVAGDPQPGRQTDR